MKFLILSVVLVLQGCVVGPPAIPNDPNFAPVMAPPPIPSASNNGSLYHANTGLNLFSDRVASNIGDILTVLLQENTTSKKSSSVDISKDSSVTVPGAGLVLGKKFDLESNLSGGNDFKGGGDAAQSNNLNGSIAVSVVNVWPNGTLEIRGEKWLTLNKGQEFIRINGLVRPDDVSPDNTVLSTKVANARITYSGTGQMADSQSMGWVSRFFNGKFWPL